MSVVVGEVPAWSFHPHKPVGERCSHAYDRDDGTPNNTWITSVAEFHSERTDLEANNLDPELSDTEHADYKAQLQRLMVKAIFGKIRFAEPRPEGKVIENTGLVIELRPMAKTSPFFGRVPRLLRLYLAEPAAMPHKLLALHLATKEASEDGLDEQDESIKIAVKRAYEWDREVS